MNLGDSYKGLLGAALALALVSNVHCGGDDDPHASLPDKPDAGEPDARKPDATPLTLAGKTADRAVVKVRPRVGGGWVALEEQLGRWSDIEIDLSRRRTLVWKESTSDGEREVARFAPEEGSLVSDFVVHPSGAVTAIVTGRSTADNRIFRFDASGRETASTPITDPDLNTDPAPFGHKIGISVPLQPRCIMSRIAASIEAIGDDALISLETGGHAVVLHRYRLEATGGYVKAWRRLVEPAVYAPGFGGTRNMSTFDTADHQAGAHRATLAVGPGSIAVVVPDFELLEPRAEAHNAFFGDALPDNLAGAVLVTRYTFDGTRLGTSVIPGFFESIGRGAAIRDSALYVVGVGGEPNADGFGLDGRVAAMDMGDGKLLWETNIDFQRSDWLMDVAPTKSGHLFVTGMSGFWRNNIGISFGEESESLVAELDDKGHLLRRITFPPRPRNNQVRSIAQSGDALLLGGFSNGPATHSADDDLTRLKADGEVWRMLP